MKNFLKSTDGSTAAEYAVMVTLIAVAVIGAVILLGSTTAALFTTNNLPSVIGGSGP